MTVDLPKISEKSKQHSSFSIKTQVVFLRPNKGQDSVDTLWQTKRHMPFASSLRTAGIVMLALLGSALLLALFVTTTNLLTVQSKDVSDVLPAHETIALLAAPSPELTEILRREFPAAAALTAPEGTEAIAVVALPDGTTGAIAFSRAPGSSPDRLPPFHVTATDSAVLRAVQSADGFLSQLAPFRALARGRRNDAGWLYLRADKMPATENKDEQTVRSLLLGDARFAAITQNTPGDWRIDRYEELPVDHRGMTGTPQIVTGSGTVLAIAGNALLERCEVALCLIMTGPERQLLALRLQAAIRETLGDAVSWEFDLVPLLAGEATIAAAKNGSGTLIVGMRVKAEEERIADTVERLWGSVLERQPQFDVQSYTFDDRFPSTTIRLQAPPTAQAGERNGWDVRNMPHGQAPRLTTATRGSELIVATDEQLAEAMMRGGTRPDPRDQWQALAEKSVVLAEGAVDVGWLQAHMQSFVPQFPALSAPPWNVLFGAGSTVQWKFTGGNAVTSLSFTHE